MKRGANSSWSIPPRRLGPAPTLAAPASGSEGALASHRRFMIEAAVHEAFVRDWTNGRGWSRRHRHLQTERRPLRRPREPYVTGTPQPANRSSTTRGHGASSATRRSRPFGEFTVATPSRRSALPPGVSARRRRGRRSVKAVESRAGSHLTGRAGAGFLGIRPSPTRVDGLEQHTNATQTVRALAFCTRHRQLRQRRRQRAVPAAPSLDVSAPPNRPEQHARRWSPGRPIGPPLGHRHHDDRYRPSQDDP